MPSGSDETIEIASGFILDAPPGELQDVMTDIKSLIGDDAEVTSQLKPAVEQYNKEQLVAVTLPGGSEQVIISEYNELGEGRYFDVGSSSEFSFDHLTQRASGPKSYVLESKNADLIKSLVRALSSHVSEHYPSSPASGVFPISDDSAIAIVIVGNKYSPANYWNGRWRSTYTYDPASGTLSGAIKVDVHYYEDGNVRLLATQPVSLSVSASAPEVVRAIAAEEKKYQQELYRAFGRLSEGAFKSLRRQLPITRQKIDWEKIGSYRLGQDIGGGRTVR